MVLVAPGLGIYLLFAIVPIGIALVYSLTDWTGISRTVGFVGLDNYRTLLGDPEVHRAFIVTFVVAVAATLILNVLAMPLAVMLSGHTIPNRLYRTAIFFPLVLSPIVVGFLWQSILNSYGLLNSMLGDIGIRPIPYLAEPGPAVASVAFVTIWQALGFTTILYLAALRTIPDEIYEAATMDGAGPVDRFRRITVPLLAPALTVNVVLLMIFFMRLYEYVLVMTQGGPVRSTQTVAYLLVANAFERSKYGYGSAIAIVMLIVVGIISVILVAVLRRRERALS